MRKILASVLALGVISTAQAEISGSTDFRVKIPEVLVLYHWDDAYLILNAAVTTPANDSGVGEYSDATAHENSAYTLGAPGPYTITGDVATTEGEANPLGTIDVVLQNSWAVRSISAADVTLTLTNPNDKLYLVGTTPGATNANFVQTSGAKLVATGVTSGSGTAELKIPSQWAPLKGNIEFKLDLSSAKKAGEYNTRGVAGPATTADEATDTFLLTLKGNPNP